MGLLRYLCVHKFTFTAIGATLLILVIYKKITGNIQWSSRTDQDYDPFGLKNGGIQLPSHSIHFQQEDLHTPSLDLHLEDGRVMDGHHGEMQTGIKEGTRIAIGLAITSKGVGDITADQVRYKFPFFR